MDAVQKLFDNMDSWRHLPSYALERRADLFFALYLPEIIQRRLGFAVKGDLVPEFPISKKHALSSKSSSEAYGFHDSYKVDYLAVSVDGDRAVLVELKTHMKSRRISQDDYLRAATKTGKLNEILAEIPKIFKVTKAKRKYLYLIQRLEHLGLMSNTSAVKATMSAKNHWGLGKALDDVVVHGVKNVMVLYVQPTVGDPDQAVITFEDFADVVKRHDDPVSRRFHQSLREWAKVDAGNAARLP